MIQPGSVRVTVMVDVSADDAFLVFTEETDEWYGHTAGTHGGRDKLRFDGSGRRVWSTKHGSEAESLVGPITVWEPPHRLVFVDQRETEVDVQFESVGERTRVTLEHRGLDRLSPDDARSVVQYGWRRMVYQFETHLARMREGEEKT